MHYSIAPRQGCEDSNLHLRSLEVCNAMYFLIAMALGALFQDSSGFEWNKKSTLTAEQKIEFPGIVLEPGVYVIRLREGGEKRSRVEILNQDETQVLATVIAVTDHRLRPDDNSEFTFHKVKGNGPQPIQTWFYTGDLVGLEFVYPKVRAREIAKDSEDHVMASNGNKDMVIVAITPNGKEIVIDDEGIQTARRKAQ
jgi:hypothetical protein